MAERLVYCGSNRMPLAIEIPALAVLLALGVLALTPTIDRCRQRVLRRVVAAVCRVLDEYDVDYWCDFGTLLGLYRDGDIIGGDKDADLCILASEKPRIMTLAGEFARQGYVLTDRGGRSRKVLRVHDRRTWYYVDLYEFVPDGDLLRSAIASPQEDIPAALVANRARASFLGAPVRVPADIHAVLMHRYGPRFMTPRRGDKGATRPYSRVRSLLEDLQDNAIGVWSWARAALYDLRSPHADVYVPPRGHRAD